MITYKVHAKLGVALTNVMLKQKPDLKGFWTQEIELPRNLSPDTERQGNSLYRVATNLKYMVFPQQTGKITIPGISFECDVLQRDVKMDAIDAFFNAIHGQKMDRFTFVDYKEHAISDGSDSQAVAYIQLRDQAGKNVFGVGISHNINLAPLKGILSAINRAVNGRA